jgi:hypothetical protein
MSKKKPINRQLEDLALGSEYTVMAATDTGSIFAVPFSFIEKYKGFVNPELVQVVDLDYGPGKYYVNMLVMDTAEGVKGCPGKELNFTKGAVVVGDLGTCFSDFYWNKILEETDYFNDFKDGLMISTAEDGIFEVSLMVRLTGRNPSKIKIDQSHWFDNILVTGIKIDGKYYISVIYTPAYKTLTEKLGLTRSQYNDEINNLVEFYKTSLSWEE